MPNQSIFMIKKAYSRKIALENNSKFYVGKVCSIHPELGGKRYTCNWRCVECGKVESKAQYANY